MDRIAEKAANSEAADMEKITKLVSVIVLSFNRMQETLECLDSLQLQTYQPIEVIVLENASSDGSRDALELRGDVTLLQMSRNHGDWEGRDIALQHCKGEFVIIVDNDAIVPPDCIEILVGALESDKNLGAVQPKIEDPMSGVAYNPGFGVLSADTRFYKAVFHGCVTMFREAALRAAGGFPHYLLGGAEDFISLRFHDQGQGILYEPGVTIKHLKSSKERVPYFRLQQQSRQKMRAKMTLAPGRIRAFWIFLRAVTAFGYHMVRHKYFLRLPQGLISHLRSAMLATAEWSPVSEEAFKKYAELKGELHPAPIVEEEDGADLQD